MRRARVRTTHATPEAATVVAAALAPDNTDSMTTRVDGDEVLTTIERGRTGGLHSSVDDYVVNLVVADRLAGADDADGRTGRPDVDDPDGRADVDDSDVDDPDDAVDVDDADESTDETDQTDTTHDNHE
ncbi:KEOPS complex subunit Pcc1 [Salinigranum salinum]|uniref:KEOPS complex subunit Pcc1 n=1 Tax=Salinigranum salinum TaxID=1364937 RepID=UPI0012608866|nr:KEOPS complex subunit Pcc1 [Salinigranum salinum]